MLLDMLNILEKLSTNPSSVKYFLKDASSCGLEGGISVLKSRLNATWDALSYPTRPSVAIHKSMGVPQLLGCGICSSS